VLIKPSLLPNFFLTRYLLPVVCVQCSDLGSKVWYTLHVSTSDVRGAGIDADVYVALVGSDGSSDKIQLPSKPEHFERGSRDTFRCAGAASSARIA
jgi:hypothetical protein